MEVGDRALETAAVVVASGSRPKMLPGLEITPRIITSDQALWYDRIPDSAVVIGAGAVGLEFASLYRSFGAEVTVVEALPRLAPLEDDEISSQSAALPKARHHPAAGAAVKEVPIPVRPLR